MGINLPSSSIILTVVLATFPILMFLYEDDAVSLKDSVPSNKVSLLIEILTTWIFGPPGLKVISWLAIAV